MATRPRKESSKIGEVKVGRLIRLSDLRRRVEELYMDGMDSDRIVAIMLRKSEADEAEIMSTLSDIRDEYSIRVAREGAAFVLTEMQKIYRRSQQRSYKVRKATDKAAKALSIRTPDWVKIAQSEDRFQLDILAKMSDLSQVLVDNGMLKPQPRLDDIGGGPRESSLNSILAPAARRAEELKALDGDVFSPDFMDRLNKATYERSDIGGMSGDGEEED